MHWLVCQKLNKRGSLTLAHTDPPSPISPDSIVVHACNCLGSWVVGLPAALMELYPGAYKVYQAYCAANNNHNNKPNELLPGRASSLIGSVLVIPPTAVDLAAVTAAPVFIVCLFASHGYGRRTRNNPGLDGTAMVKEASDTCLRQLPGILQGLKGRDGGAMVVYSNKMLSGRFEVNWDWVEEQILEVLRGWQREWNILYG
ncbi:ADP-ribose 1''-phosphate phosphatase [Apiospora saccharicola]